MRQSKKTSPRTDLTDSRVEFEWTIAPHICRACFGRVLMRKTFDNRRVYRCSNCGVEAEGRTEAAICCCGIKLKSGMDAGIRCCQSPHRSPEFPAEITASAVEIPSNTALESVRQDQKT